MFNKPVTLLMAAALCWTTLSGCAVTCRENRLTLNSLDSAVQGSAITSTATAKVLAAPVALPVGVTALAMDMALVTPTRAAFPAARDTSSLLWENPQGSDLRQMMILLPKVAATTVVFTTDWAFRSVFTTKF
jgi:hypothetical protein